MAKTKEQVEVIPQETVETSVEKTKAVRNRSGYKIELVIDGKVVVFLPGTITEVPENADIPNGIGLFIR